jgi:hypothetical protein
MFYNNQKNIMQMPFKSRPSTRFHLPLLCIKMMIKIHIFTIVQLDKTIN